MLVVQTFATDNLNIRIYSFIGWGKSHSVVVKCAYTNYIRNWLLRCLQSTNLFDFVLGPPADEITLHCTRGGVTCIYAICVK